ncbi:MAG: hypothetical protein WD077_13200 [Bacteroidia bacterium]
MKKYLVGVACLLFLISCKDEVIDPVKMYEQYYRVDTGYIYYYRVDSVRYSNFDPDNVDTVVNYLRVEFTEPYTDQAGETAYKVKRSAGKSEHGPWTLMNVWSVKKLDNAVHFTAENVKYVKMVFPVKEGGTWNGNAYNTGGEAIYTYANVHKPKAVGDLYFDSTATVVELADSNLIFQDMKSAVYATGIGLVHSERKEMETQPDPGNPDVYSRDGYITRQSLLRYELK